MSEDASASLIVAGCRGSIGVSGEQYRRYGGNTTSLYTMVEPDHYLVVDGGTGLRRLQHSLTPGPKRFTLLLTHYHWDHIQGLPMFAPFFEAANEFVVYGMDYEGSGPQEIIDGIICPPWWPITLAKATARVEYRTIERSITVGSVVVDPIDLTHPQDSIGFRLTKDRSIVIATDHEAGDPAVDGRLVEAARGAQVLIHDAQYTPDEYRAMRVGWGHSDWESATRAAREAGVERLILTSHDPDRSDDGIDAIRAAARTRFPRTDAAFEGMSIPF
ncbi:MAG: MBL fold metallo-hydrolase [Acidimicrobiia bacterium]